LFVVRCPNHQPPTINQQPSTTNHQPPTINHQPTTTNHQPSTNNHQPSTINHQPTTTIYITGVSGSGKTTVGRLLGQALSIPFADGDDFHPPANIAKMQAGIPLQDEDRWPWLEAIRAYAEERLRHSSVIIACSALKEAYRQRLVAGLPEGSVFWAHLIADFDTIYTRLAQRQGHFMPPELLASQFEAWEPPKDGLVLDAGQPAEALVEELVRQVAAFKTAT
jgi:carbohydrate kinase (thermoresistant glucokinase family)